MIYNFETHTNKLLVDRKDTTNTEAFMVYVEKGKSVHLHKHDDMEQIFYVIKGKGKIKIGPEFYDLNSGDVFYIPRSFFHSVYNPNDETIQYLSVDSFDNDSFKEPTWDDHVKVMCEEAGWDYNKVKK